MFRMKCFQGAATLMPLQVESSDKTFLHACMHTCIHTQVYMHAYICRYTCRKSNLSKVQHSNALIKS